MTLAADLQAIDWAFEDSLVRDLTHNLHPWPAKFIPAIPAAAIRVLSQPGDLVLDPFGGCGTTALEAIRHDRRACSTDINQLAVQIAKAKCFAPNSSEATEIGRWARALRVVGPTAELLESAPAIPNREYWFSPAATAQLAYLLREIRTLGVARDFLEVVFAAIVTPVSRQESETRYRRVERETSAVEVLARFRRRLAVSLEMAQDLEEVLAERPRRARIEHADARALEPVDENSVDLAVCSPPYPNAFDYHLYHRFRLFWLGHDPRPLKHLEIGAHLRYEGAEEWAHDMGRALAEIGRVLKPSAHALIVVGDGVARGELIDSPGILCEQAESVGLELSWQTTRAVALSRRSFNLADSGLRTEKILVFTK
jgi:SAM-dependent methyltransferase